MNSRNSASGRPTGTDGSDYSYRMVVDPRYMRVAKGKSRLRSLIVAQAIIQVMGVLWVFLFVPQGKGLNKFAILSITIGFISLILGELGRRRSLLSLLRLYTTSSSMATAFSVSCMVRSDFFFEVLQNRSGSAIKSYEIVEVGRVLLGVVLQIIVIITTVNLLQNMSPKRAS